jgi:hypothetical protein
MMFPVASVIRETIPDSMKSNCFDFPLWFLQYAPFFQRDRFEKRADEPTRIRSASPLRHLKVMHLSRDHRLVIAEYNENRIHHEIDNH